MEAFSFDIVAGSEAFGDASHPTTLGVIQLLKHLSNLHGMRTVLDMGCGSGILALQAAYQWHVPVIAADISKQAITATQANAEHNGLSELITAVRSDGYEHSIIQSHAPYDVIICNMLAEPIIRFAKDASAVASDEGLLLLSGILHWQEQSVQIRQATGSRF